VIQFKASYIVKIEYTKQGLAYATAHINERYSSPEPDYLKDRTIICVKIDLKSKSIEKLNMPHSSNYGMSVDMYQDKIMFGLATDKDTGFYIYDTQTGQCSQLAVIETDGYPANLYEFK
jgi:hypothetical protein